MGTDRKRAASLALAVLVPVIVGVSATPITMLIGERRGMDAIPWLLVGWCAILFASALWLNRALSHDLNTSLPFFIAIAAILLIWIWQKLAFTTLVPKSGLTYGYFLTP